MSVKWDGWEFGVTRHVRAAVPDGCSEPPRTVVPRPSSRQDRWSPSSVPHGRLWIKPSLLWMMYPSGWATKPGQKRILCWRIAREGFEWALAHGDDQGGFGMLLGERIKELRKEAGWSLFELAEKVGGDARQISRYENGRITPSWTPSWASLRCSTSPSNAWCSSKSPAGPCTPERGHGERLADIGEVSEEDCAPTWCVIGAFVTENRLRALAEGTG